MHSHEPVVELAALKHLELFGVGPEDRKLDALKKCKVLASVRFSVCAKQDVAAFYAATGGC